MKLKYEATDLQSFHKKFKGKKFDAISAFEVIEHMESPSESIKIISTMLKPGGVILMSTIAKNTKSYLYAIIVAEYILNWVPRGTHDYKYFISPAKLVELGRKEDLVLERLEGLSFDFFSGDFIRGKDVSVNYMMVMKKQPGVEVAEASEVE